VRAFKSNQTISLLFNQIHAACALYELLKVLYQYIPPLVVLLPVYCLNCSLDIYIFIAVANAIAILLPVFN
jgi:hypothetical protein